MSRKAEPYRLKIVRWYDAQGRRLPGKAKGAKRKVEQTETYYARVGGKRVSLGTTDKQQAWVNFRAKLQEHADRQAGIRDDYTEHAARPLTAHVDDWAASVEEKGTARSHCDTLAAHLGTLAHLAGWKRLPDVTAASCTKALAKLREQGLSAQTRNHYITHAKQFCRWCVVDRRMRDNPLVSLKKLSTEADRRHDRRCPTDQEMAKLFDYLATGLPPASGEKWTAPTDGSAPVRCGMSGPQRALGYRVAMATGLRADELRSLTRESFDLEAATLTLRAAYDKRRRQVTQELPPWLVTELREWFASEPSGGCWERFPSYHPGRLLKADLAGAGVEYTVPGPDGPLFFDMHSLRVWYITELAGQAGISPKTLMEKARHSTPQLTLKVYAKAKKASAREAVDQIKEPGKG